MVSGRCFCFLLTVVIPFFNGMTTGAVDAIEATCLHSLLA
jgi:hypothetical protein